MLMQIVKAPPIQSNSPDDPRRHARAAASGVAAGGSSAPVDLPSRRAATPAAMPDLAAVKKRLMEKKVPIHFEFENTELGVRFFFVRDPNQNLIAFVQRL
jgi:hypothetical protein